MNLYLQISEQSVNFKLTKTEKNIMKYIYVNLEEIENISVNAIARECHCSTAAIHRFVKKFGCDGYKQFKTEIISGKKITKFSNSKFQLNMNELVMEIQGLDTSEFSKELNKYINKRIYVYGIGGSYVSAQYFARQLNRLKIDASAYQPAERQGLNDLADGIIFISHSGETDTLVDKIKQVKLEGIPTFAITRKGSEVANQVDTKLVHNEIFNITNFNQKESQLATVLLIEKLFYDLI